MILDIELKVHHVTLVRTKRTHHKTDNALHLEIVLPMTKVSLLHTIFAHDMIVIEDFIGLIVLINDPRIVLHIDMTSS